MSKDKSRFCKWCFAKVHTTGRGPKKQYCSRVCNRKKERLDQFWERRVIKEPVEITRCRNCDLKTVPRRGRRFCSSKCEKEHIAIYGPPRMRSAVMCSYCGAVNLRETCEARRHDRHFCDSECAGEFKKLFYNSKQWQVENKHKYVPKDSLERQIERDRREYIDNALAKGWKCCILCGHAFNGISKFCKGKDCQRDQRHLRWKSKYNNECVEKKTKCFYCEKIFVYKIHKSAEKVRRKYCSEKCYMRASKRRTDHRSRAIYYGVAFDSSVTLVSLIREQGYNCYICNKKCIMPKGDNNKNEATIEHVVPMSKGGAHTWANCRIACRACNTLKSNKLKVGQQLVLDLVE